MSSLLGFTSVTIISVVSVIDLWTFMLINLVLAATVVRHLSFIFSNRWFWLMLGRGNPQRRLFKEVDQETHQTHCRPGKHSHFSLFFIECCIKYSSFLSSTCCFKFYCTDLGENYAWLSNFFVKET